MNRIVTLLALLGGCEAATVHIQLFDPCNPDDTEFMPVRDLDDLAVGDLLSPFDAERDDHAGPNWATYGKTPEIVAIPDQLGIDILAHDYSGDHTAMVLRVEFNDGRFQVVRAFEPPVLDRIMGLARDDDGFLYVASGVQEDHRITLEYPTPGEYRPGIVQVVKLTPEGDVVYEVDLDVARGDTGLAPELIINPMVAATSRMAYGNGQIALLHGINTDPDGAGVRHQKALTTHFDAETGEISRTASVWVSHSFDQRLIHDGTGFVEMHLGDAYPRDIVFARVNPDSGPYSLLAVKGTTGDNNTFSRLGSVALVDEADDPDFGYLVVFATESTADLGGTIAGPRNVGLVRVKRNFDAIDPSTGAHLDPDLPDRLTVTVDGAERTNKLQWLTDHDASGGRHAERPRIVSIGCDSFVVLWEEWDGLSEAFLGTFAMVLDAAGEVITPTKQISEWHLPRGDDAFELDNTAAWVTGDKAQAQLFIHRVTRDLTYTRDTLD